MSRIRRRDTNPELAVRSALHSRGFRFRVDYPIRVPGHRPIRPDIVFTRPKVAIFIDGCFWHKCPEHGTTPKSSGGYWNAKLAGNVERDRRHNAMLEAQGWSVVRAWEHEPAGDVVDRVAMAVALRSRAGDTPSAASSTAEEPASRRSDH